MPDCSVFGSSRLQLPSWWPQVPPLGMLTYVRHSRALAGAKGLMGGEGPAAALLECVKLKHPYSKPPALDPTLERVLSVMSLDPSAVEQERLGMLEALEADAKETEAERASWLVSLPPHSAAIYPASGFHGPLFCRMFNLLLKFGYPDKSLWSDVCKGMHGPLASSS